MKPKNSRAFRLWAATALALSLTAFTGCDPGTEANDPNGKSITVGGIDGSYEGYSAMVMISRTDSLFSYLAVSMPTAVNAGAFSAALVDLSGKPWAPADSLNCLAWVFLTPPDDEDNTVARVFPLLPIGSGNLALDWADGQDSFSASEDPQNWDVSGGVTDANAIRITVTDIPDGWTKADLIIRQTGDTVRACWPDGPVGEGSLSTLLQDLSDDSPWTGAAATDYEVVLILNDDDYSNTAYYIYESAFSGGSVQSITLSFNDFADYE